MAAAVFVGSRGPNAVVMWKVPPTLECAVVDGVRVCSDGDVPRAQGHSTYVLPTGQGRSFVPVTLARA